MVYIKSLRLTDDEAVLLKRLGFILDLLASNKRINLYDVYVVA